MNSRATEPGETGTLEDLADYLEEGANGHDSGDAVDLPGRAREVAARLREKASDPYPVGMVNAVLDVIAPYAEPLPGYSRVRVPVFLADWDGVPVVPSVEGVRAMAEQIVIALRTAVPS